MKLSPREHCRLNFSASRSYTRRPLTCRGGDTLGTTVMGMARNRASSGPPRGRVACPLIWCTVARDRASDIQRHVREVHKSERLTQSQLDSIGAQYCTHCGDLCSTHNNGARHKAQCERLHPNQSRDHDVTREHPTERPGRSRSRSAHPIALVQQSLCPQQALPALLQHLLKALLPPRVVSS